MRKSAIMAVGAAAMLSACVSMDEGDGVITHTHYSITASDRAVVQATLQTKLKASGVQMSRLEASESLNNGAVTLCGYVSAIVPSGKRSPDAVFGGMFTADRRTFMLFGGGGKGQDAGRVAQVKSMCRIAGIYL